LASIINYDFKFRGGMKGQFAENTAWNFLNFP
jgi:hypothetical protein